VSGRHVADMLATFPTKNIVTSKHSTLVGKITVFFHEGVNELRPSIVPLSSNQVEFRMSLVISRLAA
jgi:hypothetical protein